MLFNIYLLNLFCDLVIVLSFENIIARKIDIIFCIYGSFFSCEKISEWIMDNRILGRKSSIYRKELLKEFFDWLDFIILYLCEIGKSLGWVIFNLCRFLENLLENIENEMFFKMSII